MNDAVIVAGARTPIGRAFRGSLRDQRAEDLALAAVTAALAQLPELDRSELEDFILGCGLPGAAQGNNLARVVAVLAGRDELPGTTVTRYCASSVQALRMAFHAIVAGEARTLLVGGVESVSSQRVASADHVQGVEIRHPLFDAAQARTSRRSGSRADQWSDPRSSGLVPDVYIPMGQTAENVAQRYGIGREEQDAFALQSQTRAARAIASGHWSREITPYRIDDGTVVDADDSPRAGTAAPGLAALAPAFRPDGTVTAGNSCPLNDGAAALVVMSSGRARELGLTPLARVVSTGVSAISPEIMGIGPVPASRSALRSAGMSIADIDLWEINEAFAVQVLASMAELGIADDIVNVSGGAIAVGHPFGMTGARMVLSLLNNLRDRDASTGAVTMCVAGGQGMAVVLERLL